jgi:hypothetical protein
VIDPAQLLLALTEDQEEQAARAAHLARQHLGIGAHHPALVAACCAELLADALQAAAAHDSDAAEPLCLALLSDMMARVTASTAARTAIARAMAAQKSD